MNVLETGEMERRYAAGRLVWKAAGANILELLGRPEFVGWLQGELQLIEWEQKILDNSEEIVLL